MIEEYRDIHQSMSHEQADLTALNTGPDSLVYDKDKAEEMAYAGKEFRDSVAKYNTTERCGYDIKELIDSDSHLMDKIIEVAGDDYEGAHSLIVDHYILKHVAKEKNITNLAVIDLDELEKKKQDMVQPVTDWDREQGFDKSPSHRLYDALKENIIDTDKIKARMVANIISILPTTLVDAHGRESLDITVAKIIDDVFDFTDTTLHYDTHRKEWVHNYYGVEDDYKHMLDRYIRRTLNFFGSEEDVDEPAKAAKYYEVFYNVDVNEGIAEYLEGLVAALHDTPPSDSFKQRYSLDSITVDDLKPMVIDIHEDLANNNRLTLTQRLQQAFLEDIVSGRAHHWQ